MRVQIRDDAGGTIREGVQHINLRSNGDLVLRFSGGKVTVQDENHNGFEVSPEA